MSLRCALQKQSEKLRKIILLLITWGVLLGFFVGYENYFVDGQKEYLIDREFRTLNRLSAQLNAEFERARLSVNSLAKNMTLAKEKVLRAQLDQDCRGTEKNGICVEAL